MRFQRHFFAHLLSDRLGRGMEGRGGPGRGAGRGGRIFSHGGLRLVLLQLIADKPSHGYELIKAIEERMMGLYAPSPGVVYPTLTMLEEQGLVAVSAGEGNGRKRYEATPAGLLLLQEMRPGVDELMGRMGKPGMPPQPRSAEVTEAVHRLRHGMRMRLAQGPLDADQTRRFVELIDRTLDELKRL